MTEAGETVGAAGVTHDDAVAKVSVVGLGMAEQTGVAEKMFHALSEAGINIQMITTSEIKISVVVQRSQGPAALRAVHHAFQLHQKPADAQTWDISQHRSAGNVSVSEIIESLRSDNMEQLTLMDISMVGDQARVTLSGVPDQPGLASDVFSKVASAGIFVDMIVQSYDGFQGETSISFTVPKSSLMRAFKCSKRWITNSARSAEVKISPSSRSAASDCEATPVSALACSKP